MSTGYTCDKCLTSFTRKGKLIHHSTSNIEACKKRRINIEKRIQQEKNECKQKYDEALEQRKRIWREKIKEWKKKVTDKYESKLRFLEIRNGNLETEVKILKDYIANNT